MKYRSIVLFVVLLISMSFTFSASAQIHDDMVIVGTRKTPFEGDRRALLALFGVTPDTVQPAQPYLAVIGNKRVAAFINEKQPEGFTIFSQDDMKRWQVVAVFERFQKRDTSGRIETILVSPKRDRLAVLIKSNYLRGTEWFLYEIKKYKKQFWFDAKGPKTKNEFSVKKWLKL